jgi:hypothetical protein
LTFGDPTLSGWLITIGYFVVAWYCLRLSKASQPQQVPQAQVQIQVVRGARQVGSAQAQTRPAAVSGRERITWRLLAACLFVLGANKQLDLQTSFINLGRWLLTALDLYSLRNWIQLAFLVVLVVVLGSLAAFVALLVRKQDTAVRVAVGGLVWLFAFVLVRAAQFQHFSPLAVSDDAWIFPAFEAVGIAIIFWAARRQGRQRAPQRRVAQ